MKTYATLAAATLALLSVSGAGARPSKKPALTSAAPQQAAIVGVISSYEQALNTNDVDGVVSLFTDDAVVLAPNAPSAVGSAAVRAAYTGIFQAIDLDLAFHVAEVHVVGGDWAFVRSTSDGFIRINANGATVPSSNQELFVLHRAQGHWKLARYSFSSVLPA